MATSPSSYHLLPGADMHIHLRQGEFCKSLTKALIGTGIDTYLVMPNLIPPLTTTDMVMDYQATLRSYAPELTFLMTLYLSPELTPDEIRKAKRAGIIGT
ncbi:hypothetical protein HMI54_013237 [Coelomomyces lativittatus]|nr:hypothetical protein HMI54_013237 [Coelomomyces lativittatus]KAJ1499839.1 hypothetical protein HMI56_004177 [Coelomomyces lativittatus]